MSASSVVSSRRAGRRWADWRHAVQQVARLATVVLLVVAGFWGGHWLSPDTGHTAPETAAATPSSSGPSVVVRISPAKAQAAGIATAMATRRTLTDIATVPGTLEYDQVRHVEITTPVASIVEKVFVSPGDTVSEGQPLALLSSADVALARNELKRLEAELDLDRTNFEWRKQTHDNLLALLDALDRNESLEAIEGKLAARPIGKRREPLLTAYSEFLLARGVVESSGALEQQGVLSGRVYQQRLAELQRAKARLRALTEGFRFEVRQELAAARARFEVARRAVEAQKERLVILLGAFGRAAGEADRNEDSGDERLAHFVIHSPQSGRLEQFQAVPSLRLQPGDLLSVVADPDRLWIAAQIHQRHWPAVTLKPGAPLRFRLPAFPGTEFSGKVRFVGASMHRGSHALPLIAAVDNHDGKLRPGMFAWVDVPLSAPVDAIAVPTSAVQRHEGQTFLFVVDEPRTYRRVDVAVGREVRGWTAIESGIEEGTRIVSQGAFYLKSELLLEREDE